MKYNHFISIFIFLVLIAGWSVAQQPEKSDLEKKRNSIMSEISDAQTQLSETKKEKSATLAQLKALQAKLNAREALIRNINNEVGGINVDIDRTNKEIVALKAQIEKLKISYARSVRYAYKHHSAQNILAFLLTADNFNDAMRRYQYMKKNRDFRMYQADKLKGNQKKLSNNVSSLKVKKTKKEQLKTDEEEQKTALEKDKMATDEMVAELRGREDDLSGTIARKKSEAKKLDATIKSIIKKEIEIARRKAAEEEMRRKAELARKEEEARLAREAEAARRRQEEAAIAKRKSEEADRLRKEEESRVAAERKKEVVVPEKKEEPLVANNTPVKTPPATRETKPAARNNNNTKETSPARPTAVVAAKTRPDEPPKVPPVKKTTPKPNTDNPPDYKTSLSVEEQQLSTNFATNRGRLPWPVASGFISAPFGKYSHPLEPKVTLENSGVDIATAAGTPVRCVFQGTISRVVNIAGTYTVVINHGEYFTVYSYLSSVSVSAGQKVSGRQNIGVVGQNDDGEHIVHFEVCKVGSNNAISNENPSYWISR